MLGVGGVAFVTLLERKLLGLSQVRLGPNKVSFSGLLQPVADGVKLLLKESFFLRKSQTILFIYAPIATFRTFIFIWIISLPFWGQRVLMKYRALLFFVFLGIGAYAVILVGWRRVRVFSKLGSLRGILQSLSFEVALILTFIRVLSLLKCFMIKGIMSDSAIIEFNFLWLRLWFILSLMETNRAPFDLLEGERELIRGFNIELGRVSFVYLFLREYGIIIVLMLILSFSFKRFVFVFPFLIIASLLFIRRCFPRVRYDIIITFMWLMVLPISILLLLRTINFI